MCNKQDWFIEYTVSNPIPRLIDRDGLLLTGFASLKECKKRTLPINKSMHYSLNKAYACGPNDEHIDITDDISW